MKILPLAFLGSTIATGILGVLAIGELVTDKLPQTPSRKAPIPFAERIFTGALSGAAIGAGKEAILAGLLLGAAGGAAGTLGGYEFRARRVRATGGKDLPIALLEDVIAVGGGLLILSQVS